MIDWTCPMHTDSGTANGCAAQRGVVDACGMCVDGWAQKGIAGTVIN